MTVLTDKTELAANPADGDLVHVVDVSDTTGSTAGTSKKVQVTNLVPLKRTTTTLSPRTAGDDLDMETGDITATNITADTQITVGTNTTISESSGDTLIRNSSATNDIIDKLGDAAAATAKKIVDSADVVLQQVDSDGTTQIGKLGVAGVAEVKDASNVVQEKLNSVGANYSKGLSQQIGTGSAGPIDYSMADDGFLDITSGKKGWYKIVVGDNEEDANFNFSADGTVDLIDNSANVVATDTDTKFCIFDNGTNVRIRNRLGSTKVIQINGYYS